MNLQAIYMTNGDILIGEYVELGNKLDNPVLLKHVSTVVPIPGPLQGQMSAQALVIAVYSRLPMDELLLDLDYPRIGMAVVTKDSEMERQYINQFKPQNGGKINA